MRLLFILKYRENVQEFTDFSETYSYSSGALSSGLFNSAKFVVDMLNTKLGIEAKLVQVVDNNSIDKEVTEYNPTHVIIEALWVVPEKFDVLLKLHPERKWIVRGHSEVAFLANEGIAIDWLNRYVKYPNVFIATNSLYSLKDLSTMVAASNPGWGKEIVENKVLYLPNYYPVVCPERTYYPSGSYINIACFGAIRPLKNNLIQAIAALEYAKQHNKTLFFHINGSRKEQGGDNNIKNIRALFDYTDHFLVEHPWHPHDKFVEILETMDISMNVSFTETFNIVAADSVCAGVPIVCSSEVHWASRLCQAKPTSTKDIVKVMNRVTNPLYRNMIKKRNLKSLKDYSEDSASAWAEWLMYGENPDC
jgi:hypothetical protein